MGMIWELDFYSRPILDENQKKRWELLICDSDQTFQFAKNCSGAEANARWLETALNEAKEQWQKQYDLTDNTRPEKVRFFRRAMNSIIVRGCEAAGLAAIPSRRTFALTRWLQERVEQVYPYEPGYDPALANPPTLPPPAPEPLPPALRGEQWQLTAIPWSELNSARDWGLPFGDIPSLALFDLEPDTPIPGLIIYSQRALPLAGWLSGIEPAFIDSISTPLNQLILETGASDRWILATLRQSDLIKEAKAFMEGIKDSQNLHFLAVQPSPTVEELSGFWLLCLDEFM
ncbi:Tab2/Atab2 family RNA-binding protein [Candidatus Synechococcus calcipolaris G9]|uniref:Tab2/Atab2 family RNA-binding protein n=1 Tax=Candidatus Synechococcus calcipolaris G9 TaxID=1497997 RepID=A0ABT6EWY6_9SYNE|nr:Tab2/Atab2 family RNA-binding protein [Candidatus Synechococcus calcipolaris]MDG2990295.1 Tab2/Atab2 family RNA-binding protein [Candidatus Synechococcus calcipolaris G9]